MSKVGISFELVKEEMLKDEEFRIEYEKLKPRYEAIEQIIAARKEQNMTQSELARRVGTQKSNISRLESGNYNPSLDFLTKVAESLGKRLKIDLI
ncbi:MAG: helix-turn-helix transcriptional regulator [Lachnospiraceae bacterium]|nr:helix-turn-helix transcriptional regulator [Lachnospiraceae bacterium]